MFSRKKDEEGDSGARQRNQTCEEYDIPQLPYVQVVAKETLGLHPTRLVIAQGAVKVAKFKAMISQKLLMRRLRYTIMTDPDSWLDPDEFSHESFLGCRKH